MSEFEHINDSLFDAYINDIDNQSIDSDDFPADLERHPYKSRKLTNCDIMDLSRDLPKCAYIGNEVMIRRAKLTHYKCEGIWYDGIVCKILHITNKAILFQIEPSEYSDTVNAGKEYKFWVPRMALRWKPTELSVLYIKHWIDLNIYNEYK